MNFYLLLQKVLPLKILIMAKIYSTYKALETPKKKRPGIHSKNNISKSKKSKNYKKVYRGQGK